MHPENSGASDVPEFRETLRFTNQLILIPNLLPNPLSILVCVESNRIRASNLILRAAKEKRREGASKDRGVGKAGHGALARACMRVSRLMSGKKTRRRT